jgi:hypothetical protein
MECKTNGCKKEAELRGYCRICYSRLLRNGTLKKLPVKGKEKCAVEGCSRLVGADGGYGYCSLHYQRYKKYGDPNRADWKKLKGDTPEEKLKYNYKVNEKGCWVWQGSVRKKDGYGSINIGQGKTSLVHRLAYTYWKGEIPEGMFVCHHCDNPPCINPDHLFLGTNQDNMNDKMLKGRAFTGFHKGEANGGAKLTNEQVSDIKKLLIEGEFNQSEIAVEFGVSRQSICDINTNKKWSHIPWPTKRKRRRRRKV